MTEVVVAATMFAVSWSTIDAAATGWEPTVAIGATADGFIMVVSEGEAVKSIGVDPEASMAAVDDSTTAEFVATAVVSCSIKAVGSVATTIWG
jgi:hypothetical protein